MAARDPTTRSPERGTWPSLQSRFAAQRSVERACYLIGLVLIGSGLFHLGVFALDDRPWEGPLSWRKATTFGASFGLTLVTVAWVSSYLRLSPKARNWILGLFGADCILEVSGITLQAWRHVPSHFNTESAFDSTVAYTLAGGGGLLVVLLGSLGMVSFIGKIDAAPSMRLALRVGFALLIVALGTGVAMIVRGTALVRTGHVAAGYAKAGFLKPVHGVTLHAILVLPVLAWWLSRTRRPEAQRTGIVAAASAAYVLIAVGALIVSVMDL